MSRFIHVLVILVSFVCFSEAWPSRFDAGEQELYDEVKQLLALTGNERVSGN